MFIILLIINVDVDARYNATTAITPANRCKLINFKNNNKNNNNNQANLYCAMTTDNSRVLYKTTRIRQIKTAHSQSTHQK